jgi:hypothetical protein
MVVTDAPIKPSHVFFGESLINGVFPKKKPKKYAATSLIAINEAGRRNLQKHHCHVSLTFINEGMTDCRDLNQISTKLSAQVTTLM